MLWPNTRLCSLSSNSRRYKSPTMRCAKTKINRYRKLKQKVRRNLYRLRKNATIWESMSANYRQRSSASAIRLVSAGPSLRNSFDISSRRSRRARKSSRNFCAKRSSTSIQRSASWQPNVKPRCKSLRRKCKTRRLRCRNKCKKGKGRTKTTRSRHECSLTLSKESFGAKMKLWIHSSPRTKSSQMSWPSTLKWGTSSMSI